jgi:hypothetical protein
VPPAGAMGARAPASLADAARRCPRRGGMTCPAFPRPRSPSAAYRRPVSQGLPGPNPSPLPLVRLQGDPATRLPAQIASPPPVDCVDVMPPNALCTAVKCGWSYWPGARGLDAAPCGSGGAPGRSNVQALRTERARQQAHRLIFWHAHLHHSLHHPRPCRLLQRTGHLQRMVPEHLQHVPHDGAACLAPDGRAFFLTASALARAPRCFLVSFALESRKVARGRASRRRRRMFQNERHWRHPTRASLTRRPTCRPRHPLCRSRLARSAWQRAIPAPRWRSSPSACLLQW